MLLFVATHPDPLGPTIKDLASRLSLKHNSTVEHVNRTERAGLIRRCADPTDLRAWRIRLTAKGKRAVRKIEEMYVEGK